MHKRSTIKQKQSLHSCLYIKVAWRRAKLRNESLEHWTHRIRWVCVVIPLLRMTEWRHLRHLKNVAHAVCWPVDLWCLFTECAHIVDDLFYFVITIMRTVFVFSKKKKKEEDDFFNFTMFSLFKKICLSPWMCQYSKMWYTSQICLIKRWKGLEFLFFRCTKFDPCRSIKNIVCP